MNAPVRLPMFREEPERVDPADVDETYEDASPIVTIGAEVRHLTLLMEDGIDCRRALLRLRAELMRDFDHRVLDERNELAEIIDSLIALQIASNRLCRHFDKDTGADLGCPTSGMACGNIGCQYHLDGGQATIGAVSEPFEPRRCALDYVARHGDDGMTLSELAEALHLASAQAADTEAVKYEKKARARMLASGISPALLDSERDDSERPQGNPHEPRIIVHPLTGEGLTSAQWAIRVGVCRSTLNKRLHSMSLVDALTPLSRGLFDE